MSYLPAPIPANESERIQALHQLQVLDSLPEQVFDDLVLLAANICDTPIALISLVDSGRQWFKSRLGLVASETSRDVAFCSHAILEPERVLVVPDAGKDARFAENPLVTGGPEIRAYAGAPIVMDSGVVLGTLCVIDTAPRALTRGQIASLQALARQAASHFELRKLNQTLEASVAERTNELEAALEEARAASMAKSTFVATMSHEIRTPLNGVLGMLELLNRTSLLVDQRSLLAAAERSAKILLDIVNQVLDFSKIDAGAFVLDSDTFQLGELIYEARQMFVCDPRNADVSIEFHCDAHGPDLIGDRGRLRQVLINLVGNAVKFTKDLGRSRRVAIRATTKNIVEGKRISYDISVTDNGIGMSSATMANLFMPFAQGDSTISRRFGGTGLGLAISAGLLRLMGWSLDVESKLGVGSTFTLHADFELSTVVAPANPVTYDLGSPILLDSLSRSKRILVAEDNEINRDVIARQLEVLRYSCEIAEDGCQALELWRRGNFDLLLTDLQMPVLDGYGLAASIRREEQFGCHLPIVALTASIVDDLIDDCRVSGIDDVLAKPAPLRSIDEMLNRWLAVDKTFSNALKQ